jgi:hypothetical protein
MIFFEIAAFVEIGPPLWGPRGSGNIWNSPLEQTRRKMLKLGYNKGPTT